MASSTASLVKQSFEGIFEQGSDDIVVKLRFDGILGVIFIKQALDGILAMQGCDGTLRQAGLR